MSEEYANGNPKIVYYYDNGADAKEHPIVTCERGIGSADKPISFDEERYYRNGKLHSKGRFREGLTFALWEYFYETGILESKCYYQNGIPKDTIYCWHPSGKLKRELIEIDTIKKYWKAFDYFENGNKFLETDLYSDSIGNWTIDGKYNEWFENGNKKFIAVIRNNWTFGKWQEWDNKGTLIKEGKKPMNITFGLNSP